MDPAGVAVVSAALLGGSLISPAVAALQNAFDIPQKRLALFSILVGTLFGLLAGVIAWATGTDVRAIVALAAAGLVSGLASSESYTKAFLAGVKEGKNGTGAT